MNIIEQLKIYDNLYHNGNTEDLDITDTEYDQLKTQAKELFPDDPYFLTVGSTPTKDKTDLPFVLGSLNKMKMNGTMTKWVNDQKAEIIVVSDKLDGVSIYVEYTDGKVTSASTRGDGYHGQDITDKAQVFCDTPPWKESLKIRGEVLMTYEDALKLGYKNPRNAVAGILKRDGLEHLDNLVVLFYHVMDNDFTTYDQHYETLNNLCFKTPKTIHLDNLSNELEVTLAEYLKERKLESKYEIDGLVVGNIVDPTVGEDYYPDNVVAFKVNEDAVRVKVIGIVWCVKRTGKIAPVVEFEPVDINGSTISRATGFNYKFIKDNNIFVGCEIGIVKSGDVIPYIVESYSKEDDCNTLIPMFCPCCGFDLDTTETGVDLICVNDKCPDKQMYQVENYLLAHEVEEVTFTTIKKLGILTIRDLYDLDEFEMSMLEGFGPKRIDQIIVQIRKTLNTTPEKFLLSLGIHGIGSTMSKVLMNSVSDMDDLFTQDIEFFLTIDGIGLVLAGNLVEKLKDNLELYKFLIQYGLKFEEKKSDVLKGKMITLTGKSDVKRNDLMKMISSNGGMVKGISRKVDYVVTNDVESNSGKMKKARTYGVTIISYEELLEMMS